MPTPSNSPIPERTTKGLYRLTFAIACLLIVMFSWFAVESYKKIEKSLTLETYASASQIGRLLSDLDTIDHALTDYHHLGDKAGMKNLLNRYNLARARADNLKRVAETYPDLQITQIKDTIIVLERIGTLFADKDKLSPEDIQHINHELSNAVRGVKRLDTKINAIAIRSIRQVFDRLQNFQAATAFFMMVILAAALFALVFLYRQRSLLLISTQELENRIEDRTRALQNEIRIREETENQLLKAKEAADQANAAKSDFLAKMSHELRTPLNAIIGLSEMLYEEAEDEQNNELMEPLHRINRAGYYLLELINDILDLSKIEAGKMQLHYQDVLISQLIDQVQSTALPLAKPNNNSLVIQVKDDPGSIKSDPVRLRQVLLNLVSNACKFTSNGEITLQVSRHQTGLGEHMFFSVIDTGIGIQKDKIKTLFQDFAQIETNKTTTMEGTGLGLSISHKIVEMMGGRITVESKENIGSTFTVEIPTGINWSTINS